MSEWTTVEHALYYLSRADEIPHRTEGEAALIEQLPAETHRVLDLGTGDGRLLGLMKLARPGCAGVALDFSPTMLEKVCESFAGDESVRVVEHDLGKPLLDLEGTFDTVVSCFAIHHLGDQRKRELYEEDPSNRLLDVETQLRWLREIGFVDVDCYWKWLELALFGGVKPGT